MPLSDLYALILRPGLITSDPSCPRPSARRHAAAINCKAAEKIQAASNKTDCNELLNAATEALTEARLIHSGRPHPEIAEMTLEGLRQQRSIVI